MERTAAPSGSGQSSEITASTSGRPHGSERCWKTMASIDGQVWQYTAAVLTTSALALIVLFQERGFLEGREGSTLLPSVQDWSPAVKEILESLLLLLFAALIGAVGFVLLKPNLQRNRISHAERREARYWVFAAFVALLIANALAVFNMIGAQKAYIWKQEKHMLAPPFPHYFIMMLFGMYMLLTNVLYFCVVFRRFLDAEKERKRLGICGATERKLVMSVTGAEGSVELPHIGWKVASMMEDVLDDLSRAFVNVAAKAASTMDNLQSKKKRCRCFSRCDVPISMAITGTARFFRDCRISQYLCRLVRKPLSWECFGLCERMRVINANARAAKPQTASKRLLAWKGSIEKFDKMVEYLKSVRPRLEGKCRELWADVREDERYSHSAWLKSAVITAFILIVYYGALITSAFRDFLDDTYKPRRRCLTNNETYVKLFLALTGFSNSSYTVDPNTDSDNDALESQLRERLSNPQDADELFICNGTTVVDPRLAMINVVEASRNSSASGGAVFGDSVNYFKDSFIGRLVVSLDIIILNMHWTVYVGLLVGLMIGSYSLLSVLAQYKRISLAVRAGYFSSLVVDTDRQVRGPDRERYLEIGREVFETEDWGKVVSMYPMSSSMFFFGILVSTAVLQLVVFGFLVSFGLSFVTSIVALYPLMKQFVALLIAFAVTWLLNDVFSQWAFGEGVLQTKYRVLRESGFLLFLFVYTMVHLVLGILFALTRLGLLMVSSIIWLNRLDRNLYTHNKGLDEGHRSFVATVLLHAAFDASMLTPPNTDSDRSSLGCYRNPPDTPSSHNPFAQPSQQGLASGSTSGDIEGSVPARLPSAIEEHYPLAGAYVIDFDVSQGSSRHATCPLRSASQFLTEADLAHHEHSLAQKHSRSKSTSNVLVELSQTDFLTGNDQRVPPQTLSQPLFEQQPYNPVPMADPHRPPYQSRQPFR
ncbi:hypothetical protein BSKO_11750 [Bryopsis sp. KO-2023]|nr:hypothetical protein BSKO_11750 [Bryopsis sp. KO-2023]